MTILTYYNFYEYIINLNTHLNIQLVKADMNVVFVANITEH